MAGLYTSGDWNVKDGNERAFIEAWQELADWSAANVSGLTFAKLLQDEADPNHFLSFSPWRDEDAVEAWRDQTGFQERVGYIQELLESFVPRTMRVVGEVGPSTPDPW